MNDRPCATGLLAFGYPEDRYGYDTVMEITEADILQIVRKLRSEGLSYFVQSLYRPAENCADFPRIDPLRRDVQKRQTLAP